MLIRGIGGLGFTVLNLEDVMYVCVEVSARGVRVQGRRATTVSKLRP